MSFLMIFRTFGFCSSESLSLKYDLLSSKHSEESVQHPHQMADFDFDIGMGQHRDVDGRDEIKKQLVLTGRKSVFGKGLDA